MAAEEARPLLVTAEFVCLAEGDAAFGSHLERTLREVRGTRGCLHAAVWRRPGRRYLFVTLWSDADAVAAWVAHPFHRTVLMRGFRAWCSEGTFGEYRLEADHPRARRCASCGRFSQGEPGFDEAEPASCRSCGAPLAIPEDAPGGPACGAAGEAP